MPAITHRNPADPTSRKPGNLVVENASFARNIEIARQWIAKFPAGAATIAWKDSRDPVANKVFRFLDHMRLKSKANQLQPAHQAELLKLDIMVSGETMASRLFTPTKIVRSKPEAPAELRIAAQHLNDMAAHTRKKGHDLRAITQGHNCKFRLAEASEQGLCVLYQTEGFLYSVTFGIESVLASPLGDPGRITSRWPSEGVTLVVGEAGRRICFSEAHTLIEEPINPRAVPIDPVRHPQLTAISRGRFSTNKARYWSMKAGVAVFVKLETMTRVSPVFATTDELESFMVTHRVEWSNKTDYFAGMQDEDFEAMQWLDWLPSDCLAKFDRYGIQEHELAAAAAQVKLHGAGSKKYFGPRKSLVKPIEPGTRIGRLTILGRDMLGGTRNEAYWRFRCDCGHEGSRARSKLMRPETASCGCQLEANDLQGRVFGKLTVGTQSRRKEGRREWLCTCECSETTWVRADVLVDGRTESCGCLQKRARAGLRASPAVLKVSDPENEH